MLSLIVKYKLAYLYGDSFVLNVQNLMLYGCIQLCMTMYNKYLSNLYAKVQQDKYIPSDYEQKPSLSTYSFCYRTIYKYIMEQFTYYM